jgi:hypothetical protein
MDCSVALSHSGVISALSFSTTSPNSGRALTFSWAHRACNQSKFSGLFARRPQHLANSVQASLPADRRTPVLQYAARPRPKADHPEQKMKRHQNRRARPRHPLHAEYCAHTRSPCTMPCACRCCAARGNTHGNAQRTVQAEAGILRIDITGA